MPKILNINVVATVQIVVPDEMDDHAAYEEARNRLNTHLELNQDTGGFTEIYDVTINQITCGLSN